MAVTLDLAPHHLAILVTLATLASQSGWDDLRPRLEEAFETLRVRPVEFNEDNKMLLFEVAFHLAKMDPDGHARTIALAASLGKLAERDDLRRPALDAALRFAFTMSGTLAQPFVDLIARLQGE